MARSLLRWLKALFTPVAIAFLVYFAWRSREQLTVVLSEASLPNVLLAVIVWSLLHLLTPLFTELVLGGCGSKITWRAAFVIHASRLPARYLPGGIWHTVGRVIDYHDQGVQPRHLTGFVLLENGLAAAVTLALGGAIVFTHRSLDSISAIVGLCAVAGVASIPVLWLVVNRRILSGADSIKITTFASALGVVLLFWICASLAFVLYVSAFPSMAGNYSWAGIAGIYLFSWGVGFISFFAPQGIGVFELVAGELMKGQIGLTSLAVLIAGFRVVVLVSDLAVWGVCQLCRFRPTVDSSSDPT